MTDNLNQLGKELRQTDEDVNSALTREFIKHPIVHRIRDIFDFSIPFDMEFKTPSNNPVYLDLIFAPPPASTGCHGECVVAMCEYYLNETVLTTTYAYVASTVTVYRDDVTTTNYTLTGAQEVTLGFTPTATEQIKVCYVYTIGGCVGEQCLIQFDMFERSESAGWGTNDFGLAYSGLTTNPPPGSGNGASVADFGEGSVGRIRWENGSPQIFFGPNGATNGTDIGPWQDSSWTLKFRFKSGNWVYNSLDGYALVELATNARSIILHTGSNFGFPEPHGAISTDEDQIDFDWNPNQWYTVKWFYNFTTGDSWLKVWQDGNLEPDWLITLSTYGGLGGDTPSKWMRIRCFLLGSAWGSTNPYIAYFDDIEFC